MTLPGLPVCNTAKVTETVPIREALNQARKAWNGVMLPLFLAIGLVVNASHEFIPTALYDNGPIAWILGAFLLLPGWDMAQGARALMRSSWRRDRAAHGTAVGLTVGAGTVASLAAVVGGGLQGLPLDVLATAVLGVWALAGLLVYALVAHSMDHVVEAEGPRRKAGWIGLGLCLAICTASLFADGSTALFLAAIAGPIGLSHANTRLRKALARTPNSHGLRGALDRAAIPGMVLDDSQVPMRIQLHLDADLPAGLRAGAAEGPAPPTGNPVLDAALPLHIPSTLDLSELIAKPTPLLEVLHAHPLSTLGPDGLTLRATLPELLDLADKHKRPLHEVLEGLHRSALELQRALLNASARPTPQSSGVAAPSRASTKAQSSGQSAPKLPG